MESIPENTHAEKSAAAALDESMPVVPGIDVLEGELMPRATVPAPQI